MKRLRYIAKTFCVALLSSLAVSCGVIDMELDEDVQGVADMYLDHESVHVFVGDTFVVKPVFVPDTVSNRDVYFQVSDESILRNVNDTMVAVGAGSTQIMAVAVETEKTVYCDVTVMNPWTMNQKDFSDDMVVYANVTVDGLPIDFSRYKIAAFAGPDFRGEGKVIEHNGVQCVQFRVYSYYEWGDLPPSDPEMIRFGLYDKEQLTFRYSEQYIMFDSETHGSLSAPFELKL